MKYFIAIIICLFGISDGYRLIRQTACKVTASRELTLQNRQHSQRFRLFPANATPTSKFSEIHAPFKASIKYAISSIVAAAMFASPLTQQPARAGIFDSQEQNTVYEIGGYQKVVNELLDQLRPIDLPNAVGVYIPTQLLKGGKEDSAVVLNYQVPLICCTYYLLKKIYNSHSWTYFCISYACSFRKLTLSHYKRKWTLLRKY